MTHSQYPIGKQLSHFWENNEFIDCYLLTASERIPVHRIVLSRFSTLFRQYFLAHPILNGKPIEINIPFDFDNLFTKIIRFLYTEELQTEPKMLTPLLALSQVYGIPALEQQISSQISDTVTEDTILSFTRPYFYFKLAHTAEEQFPGINERFQNMMLQCDIFASRIAECFTNLNLKDVFSSVTPSLFSKVLSYFSFSQYSNDQRMTMISDYVLQMQVEIQDCLCLENCIEWTNPDAYLLFANYPADWVSEKRSRPFFRKIISQRRHTLDAFQLVIDTLPEDNSNWYSYSWVDLICQSRGETQLPEVELTMFGAQFSPSTPMVPNCGFVFHDNSTPSFDGDMSTYSRSKDVFNWTNMISETSLFYKSHFMSQEETSYAGLELSSALFDVSAIMFTPGGRQSEWPRQIQPTMSADGVASHHEPPMQTTEHNLFQIKEDLPTKSLAVSLVLDSSKRAFNIMRCQRIMVYGTFSPYFRYTNSYTGAVCTNVLDGAAQ